MLRLEKIHGQNIWDILRLKVAENQRHFVSSNDRSIIEAYTTIAGNGYAFPFGIYDDNTPVGFLMIGFGTDDYRDDAPPVATDSYNLWRLMIDEKYQNKGYGREAVKLALDFISTLPCGKAKTAGCLTSQRMRLPAACTNRLGLKRQVKRIVMN